MNIIPTQLAAVRAAPLLGRGRDRRGDQGSGAQRRTGCPARNHCPSSLLLLARLIPVPSTKTRFENIAFFDSLLESQYQYECKMRQSTAYLCAWQVGEMEVSWEDGGGGGG